jgi:hypothetical protein
MDPAETERRGRINMRVSARQERVLRAAGDLNGETLTGIVQWMSFRRSGERCSHRPVKSAATTQRGRAGRG